MYQYFILFHCCLVVHCMDVLYYSSSSRVPTDGHLACFQFGSLWIKSLRTSLGMSFGGRGAYSCWENPSWCCWAVCCQPKVVVTDSMSIGVPNLGCGEGGKNLFSANSSTVELWNSTAQIQPNSGTTRARWSQCYSSSSESSSQCELKVHFFFKGESLPKLHKCVTTVLYTWN